MYHIFGFQFSFDFITGKRFFNIVSELKTALATFLIKGTNTLNISFIFKFNTGVQNTKRNIKKCFFRLPLSRFLSKTLRENKNYH